jgi:hypothetical protein
MTQWHSTNAHSIRAHARVALAVCLLGKSKVQAQWPFLLAPLLRRLCGRCFTGANLNSPERGYRTVGHTALGPQRTCPPLNATSALPQKADLAD